MAIWMGKISKPGQVNYYDLSTGFSPHNELSYEIVVKADQSIRPIRNFACIFCRKFKDCLDFWMGVALSSSRETFYKIGSFGGRKDSGMTIKNNILVLKNKKKKRSMTLVEHVNYFSCSFLKRALWVYMG